MDPLYGKAYGRMGLAYSCVDKHREAIDCFKKAIELEPDNESYKTNLKLAEDKLSSAGSPGAASAAFPGGGLGGIDLGGLLGNPAMMNMATTLLSDPNMQNMMGQLMSGMGPGGPGGPEGPPGMPGGPANMEGLLQA